MITTRTTFFTRDKNFYKTFFRLMLVVALQNLVAYSVNMLDNIMLGSYSQNALSGAATVKSDLFYRESAGAFHRECTGSDMFSVLGKAGDRSDP